MAHKLYKKFAKLKLGESPLKGVRRNTQTFLLFFKFILSL